MMQSPENSEKITSLYRKIADACVASGLPLPSIASTLFGAMCMAFEQQGASVDQVEKAIHECIAYYKKLKGFGIGMKQ